MSKKKEKHHVKRKRQTFSTPDKGTYVQRTHKDTLFRFIFRDEKKLLQLYNALNDTSYEDTSGLVITTLKNVIYLGYKNDVSFLLDWLLYLIEHQSTWNPNIPLRGVLYFARLYKDFIDMFALDLYSTSQIELPYPQYIVFYNGLEDRAEREILHLSDAFVTPEHPVGGISVPALECNALVLNINYGKNQELLEKCKPLLDYSRFIFYIRQNMTAGDSLEIAVDNAVEQCLMENVLTDVLKANRKEVVSMFLEEYDEELHFKTLKEEGIKIATEKINRLVENLIRDNRMDELKRSVTDRELQEKLLKEYHL
ncbi:hypothetical protein NXH76_11150 [Blautia schinkii]|nr:hypothetical protein [Blautia schinkii]